MNLRAAWHTVCVRTSFLLHCPHQIVSELPPGNLNTIRNWAGCADTIYTSRRKLACWHLYPSKEDCVSVTSALIISSKDPSVWEYPPHNKCTDPRPWEDALSTTKEAHCHYNNCMCVHGNGKMGESEKSTTCLDPQQTIQSIHTSSRKYEDSTWSVVFNMNVLTISISLSRVRQHSEQTIIISASILHSV